MNNGPILVVSPNWLGDAVMALPGLRRFLRECPGSSLCVFCRPALASFWKAVEGVDAVVAFPKGELLAAARRLRSFRFSRAFLLPNSIRSALTVRLSGIPRRRVRGTASSPARRFLVGDAVRFSPSEGSLHQACEYAKILCGTTDCDLRGDCGFSPPASPGLLERLGLATGAATGAPLVGLVPGAARGPSKRWPGFADAARLLRRARPDVRFVVFGGSGEEGTCSALAAALGAPDACGRTSLVEFAAALAACDCVICNDSGGMHLAAAAGVPVVAVFGKTDPDKTGPVGRAATVVRAEGVRVSRAISRDDPEAVAALASVSPARVAEAALRALARRKDGEAAGPEGPRG